MLDQAIKNQLKQYFDLLESDLVLTLSVSDDENSKKMTEFVEEVSALSSRITVEHVDHARKPSFGINKKGAEASGIVFATIPLGHELETFVLATLQVSGRAPKVDQALLDRAKQIKEKLHFESFISLSCHICPDVVQAINILSVVNPNISQEIIDGGLFKQEVSDRDIMAVPTVYLNGEEWHGGRITLEEMLEKLTGSAAELILPENPYDVAVIGGGPAGVSAAIYASRKGVSTALIAETVGGQILETVGIENVIGTPKIEGTQLAGSFATHMSDYNIDQLINQSVAKIEKNDGIFEISLVKGAVVKAKTVIVATGAKWRPVNVPGEVEFKNKGVAYCPHCDGPLYEGKKVAVIGGGNSGIEAALDLAHITEHVTVVEFMPELKADKVLQDKLYEQKNVTVVKNAATQEIHGDSSVNAIRWQDRESGVETKIDIDGVFVQIGLVPATKWLNLDVEMTRMGEIIVDKHGQSSIEGLFAAGDCTDAAYKQIIISMGSGATAALGAFDYLIRSGQV